MLLQLLLLLAGPAESDLERLADPSREIRERAVESLAVRGPTTADLLPMLVGEDPRRAALIAAVLERRGDAAAIPALLALAGTEEGVRGRAAARALVALAFAADLPLEERAAAQGSLALERIEEAVAGAVERLLHRLGGVVIQDQPQDFRGVHAGGAMTERALRALILREGEGGLRSAALLVHLAHTDSATGPLAASFLDDADTHG